MNDAAPRIAVGALLLAAIWVATYWLWTPGASRADAGASPGSGVLASDVDAPITFDAASTLPDPGAGAGATNDTEPLSPPPATTTAQPPASTGGGIVPPEFVEYTVREGDDVWSIAGRMYGDRSHWQSIAKANPFLDINRLRAGRVIRVPVDPNNVQGRPADATAAQTPPTPAAPSEMEYIVARGDTLSGIAQSIYGRAALWTLIRDANAGRVNAEGTNIRPGMKLVIPPAPAR